MRTILIATDFSSAARNATKFGMELAKALNAKIILANAYQQMPIPITDPVVVVTPDDMYGLVREQLEMEAELLEIGKCVPFETVCEKGPSSATILNLSKKMNADMILLGIKKSGNGLRKFLGSTATELARRTTVAMMAIPEEAQYVNPVSIALANDLHPDMDVHILDTLRILVQRFHSKFSVVRVIGTRLHEKSKAFHIPSILEKTMRTLDPQYEYLSDSNIENALKNFIRNNRIDMLAMIPHKHSLLQRWLHKSHSKSMIFENQIPVLILPDKKRKLKTAGSSLFDRARN